MTQARNPPPSLTAGEERGCQTTITKYLPFTRDGYLLWFKRSGVGLDNNPDNENTHVPERHMARIRPYNGNNAKRAIAMVYLLVTRDGYQWWFDAKIGGLSNHLINAKANQPKHGSPMNPTKVGGIIAKLRTNLSIYDYLTTGRSKYVAKHRNTRKLRGKGDPITRPALSNKSTNRQYTLRTASINGYVLEPRNKLEYEVVPDEPETTRDGCHRQQKHTRKGKTHKATRTSPMNLTANPTRYMAHLQKHYLHSKDKAGNVSHGGQSERLPRCPAPRKAKALRHAECYPDERWRTHNTQTIPVTIITLPPRYGDLTMARFLPTMVGDGCPHTTPPPPTHRWEGNKGHGEAS